MPVRSSSVLSGSRNRDPDLSRAAPYGIPVAERSVPPGTWSAERVLDALHDWTREVGRPPFAYEWSPGGSRAAGRSPRVWERWAREYPRWPEAKTVAHYHRTWGAALLVAGLAGGREPLELSLNERVEAARRMAAAGFSAAQIGEELGVRAGTVGRYLRAHTCRCGRNWVVRATRCGQCAREQAALAAPSRWDRAGVIEALKRWTELDGCTPRSEQWLSGRHARGRWAQEYPAWPANATVVKLFGSWNRALQAARLPIKPYAYTDEEVLAALRADAERLGRAPTGEKWLYRPLDVPGVGAVQTHFGSWNAGLRAAGLEVNKDMGSGRASWRSPRCVVTPSAADAPRQARNGAPSGAAARTRPRWRSCSARGTRPCARPGCSRTPSQTNGRPRACPRHCAGSSGNSADSRPRATYSDRPPDTPTARSSGANSAAGAPPAAGSAGAANNA